MPPVLTEPVLARLPIKFPPFKRPIVKSVWADTPPITTDPFSIDAWKDAAVMTIPDGFLLVKNDHKFLYLLIDLVKDHSKIMGNKDYFWLSFDVDENASITPNRDINYTLFPPPIPMRHHILGKQYYLGPAVWTGYKKTTSHLRMEFGASPKSATPHRMWELQIDLKEIRNLRFPPFPPRLVPNIVHFGLRVASSNPVFTDEFPTNFERNFSNLPGILLAKTATLPTTGKPIAGVGYVPLGCIDNTTGRSTTATDYRLPTKNSAFGGILEIVGDKNVLKKMWDDGVVKTYRVTDGTEVLYQVWGNYHLESGVWHYEHFTPDADGYYDFINYSETYSIDELLFQWDTTGVSPGVHTLKIEFQDAAKHTVQTQSISLMIDNNLPDVRILEISYKGTTVKPCDIVNVTPGTDPVKIRYVAYDTEGDLRWYGLDAYFAHGEVFAPALIPMTDPTNPATYPILDHTASPPTHLVTDGHGVPEGSNIWLWTTTTFPAKTCAYEFRLWAYPNVTNGCDYIGYTEDTLHVTFQVPTPTP